MSFDRPVMGSGTRWMTQWCIPVTSRLSLISRPMCSSTWGNVHALLSAVHISVASRYASLLQSHLLCCRIPEKKNTEASNAKQNMVHSGRTNITPDQPKKSTFNGPLSSPQVAKVGMSGTIWRFDFYSWNRFTCIQENERTCFYSMWFNWDDDVQEVVDDL